MRFALAGLALVTLACSSPRPPAPPPPPSFQTTPCAGTYDAPAECGTVTVFEDRTAQSGRTIAINVVRVRGSAGSREAVAVLAGGPGEGATSLVASASGWLQPVRNQLDLLYVDQRGSGGSNPLACPTNAAADPALTFGHVFNPTVVARCRAELETRADLTKYTTGLAAADLDDVRAALGYERLSLYGGSYGTRMAQTYLRRYPARTRSVVLDGAVPVDVNIVLSYAESGQQALDRVFAASGDRGLPARFEALLHRFDAGPIAATVELTAGWTKPVRMSRGDFAYAVRGILYRAAGVRELPGMIDRAAQSGRIDEFARAYYEREIRMEDALAHGLHLSVLCAEDVPFATQAEIESTTARTFLGRYLFDDYRNACAVWPRAPVAQDTWTPITARVPTLLVSGYFDPVTPPEFAERVAKSLTLARTMVAPAGAHGVAAGCARPAVLHVLITGTLDGMPRGCT